MQETNQQSTGLRTSLAVSLYTSATEQQKWHTIHNRWWQDNQYMDQKYRL